MTPSRSRPAPPARIVHLGLGAFSRSHTAWYTAHAADAHEWGMVGYTGRSRDLADALSAQDGVYTLIERSAEGDRAEVIESIVRTAPGGDVAGLVADLASPETAIVTLTITEAGYRTRSDGTADAGDPLVAADLAALADVAAGGVRVETALGRLVLGLDARRRAGAGPLALVSCDNLSDNGGLLRRGILALCESLPETAAWIASNVSFVSSSVDRITPRLDPDEMQRLEERYGDRAPVVAEPFSDWVLSGAFPAGRPAWETAGARFTDDLEPWESRKLWMLNGAHTLLANLGPLRGHETVAQAMADPVCRDAVEALWDEASRHLPAELETDAYRRALIERFENPRIVHTLAQIALDTPRKLGLRIAPVAERERADGRDAAACAFAFGAWIAGSGAHPATALAEVSGALAADTAFVRAVRHTAARLQHGRDPSLAALS
ncbi:mannitol dehydrogenase family protein [Microbacterium sp. AZCO]|uniref:mannitol dehydrogenase family protein n=1 Tax=Microbacterium sp. AZCO TaxID=3142976 RepID=UPI0031F34FE6